jgi:hypothetical protein
MGLRTRGYPLKCQFVILRAEGINMRDDTASPQINMSKIVISGGIAGALFAGGSMLIFLVGIPLIRYMFPAAILLGCVVAFVRVMTRHEISSTSRILSASKR